jgi:hypothetical protein
MRQLMLNKIFREPRQGFVAHSRKSLLLAKNEGNLAAWLGHNYNEVFASIHAMPEALMKFPDSSDSAETAFGIAFGQPKGLLGGLFQEHPGEQSASNKPCRL